MRIALVRQRDTQVAQARLAHLRRVGQARAERTALGRRIIDAFQAICRRGPGCIRAIGLPGNGLAVDRRQRGRGVAAFQERAVVGAGAIVEREVLLELANGQRTGRELPGDIDIARQDAAAARLVLQAGEIRLGLVVETVELAGHVQPHAAELGVVVLACTTVVVVEHGEVPMHAPAHFGSDRAGLVGCMCRRCQADRRAGAQGTQTQGVVAHRPSQVQV